MLHNFHVISKFILKVIFMFSSILIIFFLFKQHNLLPKITTKSKLLRLHSVCHCDPLNFYFRTIHTQRKASNSRPLVHYLPQTLSYFRFVQQFPLTARSCMLVNASHFLHTHHQPTRHTK